MEKKHKGREYQDMNQRKDTGVFLVGFKQYFYSFIEFREIIKSQSHRWEIFYKISGWKYFQKGKIEKFPKQEFYKVIEVFNIIYIIIVNY